MAPHSSLSRTLAPLAGVLWALFIVVSVMVAAVWISGFGEGMSKEPWFQRTFPSQELRVGLLMMSRAIDPAWIALGAVAVYLSLARTEGLAMARRWALMIIVAGFVIAAASANLRWPLGPVYYPENLGWKIGTIPFGLPLLWFIIVVASRDIALRIFPRAGHGTVSLLTGLISLVTSANLDPVAWKYRAWWLWYPNPYEGPNHAPLQSYATWFLAAVFLSWMMRSIRTAMPGARRPGAPLVVWSVLNVIVLATYAALRVQ